MNITTIAGPIATIVAAGVAAYFARAQLKIADAQKETARVQAKIAAGKLKLELFDRRYKVYQAIAKFLSNILSEGDIRPGEDRQFLVDTKDATFLFDNEIALYIDDLYKRANNFHHVINPGQFKRPEKRDAAFSELTNDLNSLRDRFAKFLDLSSIDNH